MRDAYLKDLKELDAEARTDFSEVNYPKFMAAMVEKATEVRDIPGYKLLHSHIGAAGMRTEPTLKRGSCSSRMLECRGEEFICSEWR